MEKILLSENGLDFCVSDEFKSEYLAPIILNVLEKAENCWDDYNEAYRSCQLVENVKKDKNMHMDFHFIKKSGKCLGVVFFTSGKLNRALFFSKPIAIEEDIREILILNSFHISPEGRGNGERWLLNIIMPYYKTLGFKAIYLKSSHPKAFPFYNRLGQEIGEYTAYSDNNLFERRGKVFKIAI